MTAPYVPPEIWIRATANTEEIPIVTSPTPTAHHHARRRMTVALPTLIPAPQGPVAVTVIERGIRKPSEAFPEYHASPKGDLWRSRYARHRPTLRLKFPTPLWVTSMWWVIAAFASMAAGFAYGFRAGIGTWTP